MSKSLARRSIKALLCGALVAAGVGLGVQQAQANMTVSLQFPAGVGTDSTHYNLTGTDVGKSIEIDVVVTITGTLASRTAYGLQYVNYSVLSSLPTGTSAFLNTGAGQGKSGIVDSVVLPPFNGNNGYLVQGPGVLPAAGFDFPDEKADGSAYSSGNAATHTVFFNNDGIPADLLQTSKPTNVAQPGSRVVTGHGILEIGDTLSTSSAAQIKPRTGGSGTAFTTPFSAASRPPGNTFSGTTTTYLVDRLYFKLDATSTLQTGQTVFNPVIPNATSGGDGAAWTEDNNQLTLSSGTWANGTSVTFAFAGGYVPPALGGAGVGTNRGTLTVKQSSPGNYDSTPPLPVNAANGFVQVNGLAGIGTLPVYVMLWLSDPANDSALLGDLATNSGGAYTVLDPANNGNGDSQFPLLMANYNYPALGGSPSAMLKYTSGPGSSFAFNFDFTQSTGGELLTAIAVVPEPTTFGLLALGALALLRRRR